MGLVNDFKAFLLRGNVIDLAVAVVIGAAFKSIVDSFVTDLVTPLIGAFGGEPDFSSLHFTINSSRFMYGAFLNQVISFVIIAAVIFFFVITPVNALMARAKKEPPADPTLKKCPECVSDIAVNAKRCPFCTSQQAA
jgi:large conductance mechanosensitive channel